GGPLPLSVSSVGVRQAHRRGRERTRAKAPPAVPHQGGRQRARRRHQSAERHRPHRQPLGPRAPRDPDVIGRRTRAGGFRRFYLYSALSVAVLAAALGIGAPLNAVLRAAGVGLAAWLWVDTTVPEDTRRRTQAARVGMAVTMIGATLAMARAAGAAGNLANTTPPEPPRLAPFLTPDLFAGELRAGLVSAAYA